MRYADDFVMGFERLEEVDRNDGYYGVTGNIRIRSRLRYDASKLWRRWLEWRNYSSSSNWKPFQGMLRVFLISCWKNSIGTPQPNVIVRIALASAHPVLKRILLLFLLISACVAIHGVGMIMGLRKPVNDLSSGAFANDIIYTTAVTAVQSAKVPQPKRPNHVPEGKSISLVTRIGNVKNPVTHWQYLLVKEARDTMVASDEAT